MCTFSISVDDTLMERVRPSIAKGVGEAQWMQEQFNIWLTQFVTVKASETRSTMKLSQRLRGIAHAPADYDYKKELANRHAANG